MSAAPALAGWGLALCALTVAAVVRCRSSRYAEAVARACHELRGPLAALRLGLDLALRAGQLPNERLRGLDLEVGRAGLALDDLSKVWQREPALGPALPVEHHHIDVSRLLADSVEAFRGSAAARGVELRLLGAGSHAVVTGERLRLAQAIGNLIANAIEHGGGVVDVSWRSDRSTVRIEVADRGVGLPAPVAELRGSAGRPHRRAEPPGWRTGGLLGPRTVSSRGHGLAIASAIAAGHGGRLAAAPSERGARLVLELPIAEATVLSTPAGG